MKSPARIALILALLTGAVACNHTVSRALSRDHIGTKYARLQNYFAAADRVEEVPGDIRHDAVIDEAILASVGDGESCAQITLRTARIYDEPISQQQPSCIIDGQSVDAVADEEVVSVYDYTYAGRVETVAVSAVAADTFMGLSLTEPGEKIFRVVERQATVCCPTVAQSSIKFAFENERMDYNNLSYSTGFEWLLQ
ncbi:hypothetical protein [Bradymonas sediminis]|uniref:Uncharacterized protein n=1 Tax=Bradymonas sediminis TaxID=1548548 RepID=A0A2Z4FHN2_9DELT|nr:hypothetical protein [Bradymonas sediminis]AWV88497.1 hypothetical protein DN745_03710 [Bradymonas sediminis]TDP77631.1 hypothetical protein DFR33_101536 [Bradymonas sediminis]